MAAGDQATLGITPPGKTQTPFCASVNVLQFGVAYGSPAFTVYPNRCESSVGQPQAGQVPPAIPSTDPVRRAGSKMPWRWASVGTNNGPVSALSNCLVP